VNPFSGYTIPNTLAQQLGAVARMIAVAPVLGLTRQVFFVSLGGFDSHANQNSNQPDLLGQVAQAMAYFDGVLGNIGGVNMRSAVTTFTASDFSRTFTTNGSGTDHAWGSYQFVMGGALKTASTGLGDMYGQYPTLGVDSASFTNPNAVGNALVPTISVDQYAATLGAWMGVTSSDLAAIFPNLANFSTADLGFMNSSS
jgi:uncharacterized protein (DUF1501 family)